jgi:hypothetical protein
MQDEKTSGSSAEISIWVWIFLVGLLVFGALLAIGSMTIININQQNQLPTGTQPAPAR